MRSGHSRQSGAGEAATPEDVAVEAASSGVRDTDEAHDGELDPRAEAEARLGEQLEAYRLEEVLGIGGTAAVYRAVNAAGETFALKVLHSALGRDVRARRRFLREAQIARRLVHPRVVRILATSEAPDGTAYHVMDLHEGVTLERRRASAPEGLSCDTVIPWVDDLLAVLTVAHSGGIIHRDIKPANLLLDRKGRVHVLDFGMMRLAPEQGSSSLVTRSGMLLGTVPFMPPEQALGRSEEIDARTDVWAIGATMFTLITGKLVHSARSLNEALVLAATQAAPPIRQVDPSVSKPLAAIIDRALAFDKADRFADAGAMRVALRRACGLDPDTEADEAASAPTAASTQPEESLAEGMMRAPTIAGLPRPFRPSARRTVMGVVVVVAAGAALAWAAMHAPESTDATAAMVEPSTATVAVSQSALPRPTATAPSLHTTTASAPLAPAQAGAPPGPRGSASAATVHAPAPPGTEQRPPATPVRPPSTTSLPPF